MSNYGRRCQKCGDEMTATELETSTYRDRYCFSCRGHDRPKEKSTLDQYSRVVPIDTDSPGMNATDIDAIHRKQVRRQKIEALKQWATESKTRRVWQRLQKLQPTYEHRQKLQRAMERFA